MRVGVIYGLPEKYATTIRMEQLTKRLPHAVKSLRVLFWPRFVLGKGVMVLVNVLRVLNPFFRPHVIYCSGPLIASSIPGIVAKYVRRIPLVVDWDDCFVDFSKEKPRPWKILFWEYAAVEAADHVVVVSSELEMQAKRLGKERVTYIPNGVDLRQFDPKKHSGDSVRKKHGLGKKFVIGFVGTISFTPSGKFAGKELIDAATVLKRKGALSEVAFLVVGFGEGAMAFRKYAEDKDVLDHFVLAGFVPHKKIPEYMAAMDAYVLPIDDTLYTARTRSSCKLKEYLAMDKPVVTVAIGEAIKDTDNGKIGILVPRNEDIVIGIEKLLKKRKGIRGGRSHMKNYSFDVLSKKLEKVFNV